MTPALQAELTDRVGHLRLQNDRNWCYANSCFFGLLWTMLSQVSLLTHSGGMQFAELIEFVRQGVQRPLRLFDTPWFQQLLQNWGQPDAQQDCAECTYRFLQWLHSDVFDMRWERRLATTTGVEVLDIGSCFKPICLSITHEMHQTGCGSLAKLITDWHQELSMRQALLHSPCAVCIHLDRWYQNAQGDISKSLCKIDLDGEVDLPIFQATGLQCDHIGFIPVAGISHLGHDQAGHCRAMLRIQPVLATDGHPANWLITDDEVAPEPVWNIPDFLLCNLVVIWLVRTDCLQMPTFASVRMHGPATPLAAATSSTTEELLQLLNAQPGATT